MRIYRVMSIDELNALAWGLRLVNNNKFRSNRTSSEGFCFFRAKTLVHHCNGEQEDEIYGIERSIRLLSGIVKADSVLVEFDAPKGL